MVLGVVGHFPRIQIPLTNKSVLVWEALNSYKTDYTGLPTSLVKLTKPEQGPEVVIPVLQSGLAHPRGPTASKEKSEATCLGVPQRPSFEP